MKALLWISMLLFLLTGRGSLSEGKPPIKLNAILGEKITFTYQLSDEFEIGDIYWYFNNTVITAVKLGEHISSRKTQFEGRLDDIHYNGSLQISNLTMKDRGSYKAEISKAQGGTDQTIYEYELKIFTRVSKPNITVTVDIVNKTCYITLSCTAEEGGDHVNYTWSGENIKPSVGSILYLSKPNPNTNLKIYCTAANPASRMSALVKPWKSCPKGSTDKGPTTYSQINSPSVVGRPGLPYDNELLGTNTFVRSLQLYAQSYNMSEGWVCGANVVSETAGYPWIGIPWTERHLRDPQQRLQWETVTQTKPWRKHRLHLAVPARDGAFCITQTGTLPVGNSSCNAANVTVQPGLSSWGSYELRQLNLTATLINRWVFGTINTENCPNLALPRGIYWLCGPWAYRWLPCGWGGDCYLGFVIPAIHHRDVLPQGRLHNKRSFVGKPEGAADIAFAPFGVYWAFAQIDRLATLLDELMNETTDAIAQLNTEQQQARLVVLQNRMSLDYLLAAKGGVCALVGSECCSYIEDQSGKVVQDLEQLEEIQSKLRTPEEGSWFS